MKRWASLGLLLLSASLPLSVACGSDAGSSEANIETGNAEYDRVIAAGAPKVTLNNARTADQSASGRLVGWIPGSTPGAMLTRFAKLNQWNEIKNAAGEPIFKSGKVIKNTIEGGNGQLEGELVSAVTLKLGGKSVAQAERYVLHLENTETAKKLFVSVIDKGKMTIDVKFVPYAKDGVSGVILDASLKVKLNVSEEEADALASGLTPIFEWLKADS